MKSRCRSNRSHRALISSSALAASLFCLICAVPGSAAQNSPAQNSPPRVKAFARLPNWSGIWRVTGGIALFGRSVNTVGLGGGSDPHREVRDYPPYTPEWEAKYQRTLLMAERQTNLDAPVGDIDTNTVYCAAGWPRLFAVPFLMQFVITPEETLILYDQREV
jgi:hypothetical protein